MNMRRRNAEEDATDLLSEPDWIMMSGEKTEAV